jgi:hypothetical protein
MQLTHKDKRFKWEKAEQSAFQRLKKSIAKVETTAYFDIEMGTEPQHLKIQIYEVDLCNS